MALTNDQQASAAATEVWRTYWAAMAKLKIANDDEIAKYALLAVPGAGPAASFTWSLFSMFSDASEGRRQAESALASMKPTIEKWNTTLRAQAERGVNAAGSPYTWDQWFEFGKELIRAIDDIYQIGADYSLFGAVNYTAVETGDQLWKKAANAGEKALDWLGYLKWGAIGIGAFMLWSTYMHSVKPTLVAAGRAGAGAFGGLRRRRGRAYSLSGAPSGGDLVMPLIGAGALGLGLWAALGGPKKKTPASAAVVDVAPEPARQTSAEPMSASDPRAQMSVPGPGGELGVVDYAGVWHPLSTEPAQRQSSSSSFFDYLNPGTPSW